MISSGLKLKHFRNVDSLFHFPKSKPPILLPCCPTISSPCSIRFNSHFPYRSTKVPLKCAPLPSSDSLPPDLSDAPTQTEQNSMSILEILKQSNSYLPHVLIASILLALIYPPSLTWFTSSKMNQAQELYWWLVLVVPSFQVMLLS
ncbi:putative sodium/metabolite cotransporter BASS5, chloroplastic [Glycine max]|nr:putative sodium/metabolite cotransporter BASS5, chloroplastic [Glycine max]